MISEIEFIRYFTSFWRTISPLSEDFVRYINVKMVENRVEEELYSDTGNSRRALINETAFEIFRFCIENNLAPEEIISTDFERIAHDASLFISKQRSGAPKFSSHITSLETEELFELSKRLINYFSNYEQVIVKPTFAGLGRLDMCQGDVIADNILFEIKSGSRGVRSIDLRQLVLYLTLNFFSKQMNINKLGLYNPRKGLEFILPHEEFSIHFCGLSTEELCHRIGFELNSANPFYTN